MKNKILLSIVILLIPLTLISFSIKKSEKNKNLQNKISKKKANKKKNIMVSVNLEETNKNINIDLENYIIGVVAGEMPASYSLSALQSQAIASRSYVINFMEENENYNLTNTTSNQVYITKQNMQEKWQDKYDLYYNKIKQAVDSTKNKVMKYDGKTIKAFYFAVSNGYTEDVQNVFGEPLPYLKSVESDESSYKNYINNESFTQETFCTKLNLTNCNKILIKDIIRDNTNRVLSLNVNNKIFKGTEFRTLLNLKSTDFDIEIKNNIKVTTRGYGHGVGMSQYGAELMAKEGYTYNDILKKYYQDIKITNI